MSNRIRKYGYREWKREMDSKSTLELYARFKGEIGKVGIYDNSYNSVLMYRARTNTLKLRWRNRFGGGAVDCRLWFMWGGGGDAGAFLGGV